MGIRCFVALLFAVMLAACARESNREIVRVSIDGQACPRCLDNVMIERGGRIEEVGPHGMIASNIQVARDAIDRLPLEELHHPFALSALTSPATMVDVRVGYRDGSQERAVIPIGKVSYPAIGRMQAWTEFTAGEATLAVMGSRWRGLSDAFRRSTFSSITLESGGCYGWCPAYAVTFASNGIASIRDRGPHCDETAKANVPFANVLEAALLAGAGRLRPYYAVEAVDTLRASLTFTTPKDVFVSEGPDRTTWGPEFLATVSRLDQIVRDARWTPTIDLRRCAGAPNNSPARVGAK